MAKLRLFFLPQPGPLIERLLFVFLCSIVVLAPLLYGSTDRIIVLDFQLLIFLALAIWAVWLISQGKSLKEIRFDILLLPLGLYALYIWSQTLSLRPVSLPGSLDMTPLDTAISWQTISLDPVATQAALVRFLSLCAFAFLALNLIRTKERLATLVNLIVVVGALISLQAIIQDFTYNGKIYWIRELNVFYRAFGPFGNKDHGAGYLELPYALGLGLLARRALPPQRRLVYAWLTLVTGVAILVSRSRGGVVSLVGTTLVLLLLNHFGPDEAPVSRPAALWRLFPWTNRLAGRLPLANTLLIAILLLGGIFGTAFWLNREAIGYSVETLTQRETYQTLAGRQEIWRATLEMIKEAPVLGLGFGAYNSNFPRFTTWSGQATTGTAHNDYLQVLTDTGLIGTLIVLGGLILYGFSFWRSFWQARGYPSGVLLGTCGGVVSLLIHSLFDYNLQIYSIGLTFLSFVVLGCAVAELYSLRQPRPGPVSWAATRTAVAAAYAGTTGSFRPWARKLGESGKTLLGAVKTRRQPVATTSSQPQPVQEQVPAALDAVQPEATPSIAVTVELAREELTVTTAAGEPGPAEFAVEPESVRPADTGPEGADEPVEVEAAERPNLSWEEVEARLRYLGRNEAMPQLIIATIRQLPEEVAAFALTQCLFISVGESAPSFMLSQRESAETIPTATDQWLILLADDLLVEEDESIIVQEIAEAWLQHFEPTALGLSEHQPINLLKEWGFVSPKVTVLQ